MNSPILNYRIVNSLQNRRLSFFRRFDGLFFYQKEEISEWDDAPPRWVETSTSGLYPEIETALQDSSKDREWLQQSSLQDASPDQRKWRPLGVSERNLVALLAGADGQVRLDELDSMMVATLDKNRSLRFHREGMQPSPVQEKAYRASYSDGVDRTGARVEIVLHTAEGLPTELLIRKLDDSPIQIDPFELDGSKFQLL